jgi:hypothetical protein
MKTCAALLIGIALVSASAEAHAQPSGSAPLDDDTEWRRNCSVERVMPHGVVSLSREFTDDGRQADRFGDFVYWTPADVEIGQPARPLDMRFSYFWRREDATPFRTREMELKVVMRLDQAMPSTGLLRVMRPFPIEGSSVVDGPALTMEVFGDTPPGSLGGHGDMPLGDLLAYGEGYETLDWMFNRFSEEAGYGLPLARGVVDLRGFRDALAALPEMRAQLDVQAADVRRNCERRRYFPPPILY